MLGKGKRKVRNSQFPIGKRRCDGEWDKKSSGKKQRGKKGCCGKIERSVGKRYEHGRRVEKRGV
jgi:hypothetical protein